MQRCCCSWSAQNANKGETMKVLGVEQTHLYNQIYKLIEAFKKSAKAMCIAEKCNGTIGHEIVPGVQLSYHKNTDAAYLRVDEQSFMETPHQYGEMEHERMSMPITIMSLYHKLEGFVIVDKIKIEDIERVIIEIT